VLWRGVDGDLKLKASASFSASRISVPDPHSATCGTTGSAQPVGCANSVRVDELADLQVKLNFRTPHPSRHEAQR